jgi:hypothetical protein
LSSCCLATYFLGAPGLFLQLWFGVAVREFMSVQLPFKLHICTERRMEHRDRRGRSTIHLATIKLCTSCSQTVYCRHECKIKEEEENYDEACLDVWYLLNMVALKRDGWFLVGLDRMGQLGQPRDPKAHSQIRFQCQESMYIFLFYHHWYQVSIFQTGNTQCSCPSFLFQLVGCWQTASI